MAVIPIGNPAASAALGHPAPASPIDPVEDLLRRGRAGTFEIDAAEGALRASDSFFALLGFTPAAGRQAVRHWLDRAHPEDQERAEHALEGLLHPPAREFEVGLRMQHVDGGWRWLMLRGRPTGLAGGTFRRVSGVAVDLSEKHEVHEYLLRTEQRYSRAIAAIRGLVYEVDLATDGLIMHGVEKVVGGGLVEPLLTLDSWSNRVHPDDRERLHATIYANRARGTDYELHYRVFHNDGRVLNVWHRGSYVKDSSGRPVLALGVINDITADVQLRGELQRAEQALRESQQILATVSESSPVHLALFDLDRRCVFVNRPLPGTTFEQVLGKRLDEMLPEDLVADSIRNFTTVVQTGGDADIIDRIQFPGMEPRYYRMQLRPVNRDGRVIGVVANVADVTESRRQLEHQQLQANIIERMHEGVMLLDRDARILFTNPALESMFGYSPGELTGVHAGVLSYRSASGIEDVRRMVLDEVDAGRSAVVSFIGRMRDGRANPCQAVYSGARIGDRNCVIAVLTDVSEQKRLQRELLKVETRVQHRVGSDLHDGVGQQLAGIAMMLRALSQRASGTGGEDLRGELKGITELVNSVLRTTRLMARGLTPVRAGSDGLLEGFEELAQQVTDRFGVQVDLDIGLPPLVELDENTASNLYRIAQEGMLNAARHSKARRISVSMAVVDRLVELNINDDGCGFDPYSVRGGGMGLRVMRFRAQMISGYLIIDSQPGRGTNLRCRCPVRPDSSGGERELP
jgi:PAS domain S-box-containing protein